MTGNSPLGPSFKFMQMKIIELPTPTTMVRRRWRERWFSRPWQPTRRWKKVPNDQGQLYEDSANGIIYATPAGKRILMEHINMGNK